MEPQKYELRTFEDLTKLDDDQIDRLCSELPAMVRQVKAFIELMNVVGDSIGIDGPVAKPLSPLVWIDDGKRDLTISLTPSSDDS